MSVLGVPILEPGPASTGVNLRDQVRHVTMPLVLMCCAGLGALVDVLLVAISVPPRVCRRCHHCAHFSQAHGPQLGGSAGRHRRTGPPWLPVAGRRPRRLHSHPAGRCARSSGRRLRPATRLRQQAAGVPRTASPAQRGGDAAGTSPESGRARALAVGSRSSGLDMPRTEAQPAPCYGRRVTRTSADLGEPSPDVQLADGTTRSRRRTRPCPGRWMTGERPI